MKKYFLFIVLAISAMAAQAQCTWNVRAGFGLQSDWFYDSWYKSYIYEATLSSAAVAIQCNIPISKSHKQTFSPTLFSTFQGECFSLFSLLQYGYKIGTGIKGTFYPKIGLALGGTDVGFTVGGSVELAYEYKHFIVAVNYIPAVSPDADGCFHGLGITYGYKF